MQSLKVKYSASKGCFLPSALEIYRDITMRLKTHLCIAFTKMGF